MSGLRKALKFGPYKVGSASHPWAFELPPEVLMEFSKDKGHARLTLTPSRFNSAHVIIELTGTVLDARRVKDALRALGEVVIEDAFPGMRNKFFRMEVLMKLYGLIS